MWSFKQWRRQRILQRYRLPDSLWQQTLAYFPFLDALNQDERARLRDLTTLFLHQKRINGAAGIVPTDAMKVVIAVQACLLILNLDLDYYREWVEIILYPSDFIAEHEYTDEHGIVQRLRTARSGESWLKGPVVLSWQAVEFGSADGFNVVIHEFAHKLDMLNGGANGFPPLHAEMDRKQWSEVFGAAYEDFCRRVDQGADDWLNPYAAESPAEFFAVISEMFFELPHAVRQSYPQVYRQLAQFYRQDPLARVPLRQAPDDFAHKI